MALDLLRGSFLIEIIVNHISWSPSVLTFIGGGGRLPASAAEGFFAISGLLVGYLYGPRIIKNRKKVFIKIWQRAALLYGLTIFFTFFYTAWAFFAPESVRYTEIYNRGDTWQFLYETLTLHYAFGWADFLGRYAVFMLFAPFVLLLITRGKAWIVAIVSFAVWFFLRKVDVFVPFSAWQLIFMFGIIIGYYLPQIEYWFKHLKRNKQRLIFRGITMVAFVTYIYSVIFFVAVPILVPTTSPVQEVAQVLTPYFDKNHLSPLRLIVGTVWFIALYMVYRRYEKEVSRKTLGILEVFGRQSLFVYCLHAFVLFAIDLYLVPPPMHNKIINTVITVLVLAIIYFAAYYRGYITKFGKRILGNRASTQVP